VTGEAATANALSVGHDLLIKPAAQRAVSTAFTSRDCVEDSGLDEFRRKQSGCALISRRLRGAVLQNQQLTLVGMMPSSTLFATWIEISWPPQNMHSARNYISTNFTLVGGFYQEVTRLHQEVSGRK
jgi:hypothetical protein